MRSSVPVTTGECLSPSQLPTCDSTFIDFSEAATSTLQDRSRAGHTLPSQPQGTLFIVFCLLVPRFKRELPVRKTFHNCR